MKLKQLFASFTLLLMIFSLVAAQSPDSQDTTKKEQQKKAQEEREKKAVVLLDEIIKETSSLKLPENRLRIQVGAADLLWSRDEKRARALFKEIISTYAEIARKIDANPTPSPRMSVMGGMGPYVNPTNPAIMIWLRTQLRQEILQVLMIRDAKWGREFLRESRQSSVAAFANLGMAHMDVMMDMQLATQIAGSDPKQALEIAQENFDKAFSTGQRESLISLMQQIHNKDHEAGAKLAGDFMKKLRSENLTTNSELTSSAMNFLRTVTQNDKDEKQTASKKKESLLDEQSLKELVGMLVTTALSTKSASKNDDEDDEDDEDYYDAMSMMEIQFLVPLAEKYAPSRVAALRAKINEFTKSLDPQERAWSEIARKGQDITTEDMLEAASKVPAELRNGVYLEAARMAIRKGEIEKARQIANENITDAEQQKSLLAETDRWALSGAAAQGKLEDARNMLAQVESAEERAMILNQLAAVIAGKGDKKTALQLISEARSLAGNQPESAMQFGVQIEMARASASIDPVQSFEILEGMIEQFNALVAASAILDSFENRQQFREGEMNIKSSGQVCNMLQYWASILQPLAREDFDRARVATERLQRSEVRLMAQLSVVEGVLSTKVDVSESSRIRSFMQQVIQN